METLQDLAAYVEQGKAEEAKKLTQQLLGQNVSANQIVKEGLIAGLDQLGEKFEKFEKENPKAKYFMIDGTHRTTALTLSDCKITVILYEKDVDIVEAKELVDTGEISENATLYYSLVKNCKILNKHFNVRPYFMTVEQKTQRMVKEKVLPKGMRE